MAAQHPGSGDSRGIAFLGRAGCLRLSPTRRPEAGVIAARKDDADGSVGLSRGIEGDQVGIWAIKFCPYPAKPRDRAMASEDELVTRARYRMIRADGRASWITLTTICLAKLGPGRPGGVLSRGKPQRAVPPRYRRKVSCPALQIWYLRSNRRYEI